MCCVTDITREQLGRETASKRAFAKGLKQVTVSKDHKEPLLKVAENSFQYFPKFKVALNPLCRIFLLKLCKKVNLVMLITIRY